MGAMGLLGPLCGYLLHSHTGLFGYSELYPPLIASSVLFFIASGLVLALPVPHIPLYSITHKTTQCINLTGALLAGLILGVMYGALEPLVIKSWGPPWFIEAVAGPMLAMFFLIWLQKLSLICGSAHIISLALVFYSVRFFGKFLSTPELAHAGIW